MSKKLINKKILANSSKLILEEFKHIKIHIKLGVTILKNSDYSIITINGILDHHKK